LSERAQRNFVCGDIRLGKRIMEGSQVGIRRNIRAVERVVFVDNRDLILFNHGNSLNTERMNVEDKESRDIPVEEEAKGRSVDLSLLGQAERTCSQQLTSISRMEIECYINIHMNAKTTSSNMLYQNTIL
jgi:hypothetical protein